MKIGMKRKCCGCLAYVGHIDKLGSEKSQCALGFEVVRIEHGPSGYFFLHPLEPCPKPTVKFEYELLLWARYLARKVGYAQMDHCGGPRMDRYINVAGEDRRP